MHALELVFADDGVLQRPALLDDEHGVVLASFARLAVHPAVVRLHAAVKHAGDDLGFREGFLALGLGEGEGEALGEGFWVWFWIGGEGEG